MGKRGSETFEERADYLYVKCCYCSFLGRSRFSNLLTIANTVDSRGRPTWDIYVTGGQLNVTIPHKPLHKYRDYVRIDALSWGEAGVNFWGDGTYPFIFNPKGKFLNVTRAWVSVVISIVGNRSQTIYLYLNNNPIYSWEFPPIQRLKITFPITNSTVLQSIKPGVNIIQSDIHPLQPTKCSRMR